MAKRDARVEVWRAIARSEEHTSELQSPDTISYAVFCLKKKNKNKDHSHQKQSYNTLHNLIIIANSDCFQFNLDYFLYFFTFYVVFFFFNDTATTEIYTVSDTLSLHDALPIFLAVQAFSAGCGQPRSCPQ